MPAKRILFGFLLCLALGLVVLAAQALTLGTEKSLFPYRTEQVACVEFQNGTTGARHLDKAQRVIQDVMDHLHRFSPDAAVPNQWDGWTYWQCRQTPSKVNSATKASLPRRSHSTKSVGRTCKGFFRK